MQLDPQIVLTPNNPKGFGSDDLVELSAPAFEAEDIAVLANLKNSLPANDL